MKVKKPSMLKRLKRNQRGFTLIELLVAIALTSIIGTAAAMSIHQVLTGSALSNDLNTAINQVRNAGYWLEHDALMAQSVNASGESEFSLTLTWTDWDDDTHQVVYGLEDSPGELKRLQRQETINDAQVTTTTVGRYIDADNTSCHWDGEVLTVNITAEVGDTTETRTFQVKPRPD